MNPEWNEKLEAWVYDLHVAISPQRLEQILEDQEQAKAALKTELNALYYDLLREIQDTV